MLRTLALAACLEPGVVGALGVPDGLPRSMDAFPETVFDLRLQASQVAATDRSAFAALARGVAAMRVDDPTLSGHPWMPRRLADAGFGDFVFVVFTNEWALRLPGDDGGMWLAFRTAHTPAAALCALCQRHPPAVRADGSYVLSCVACASAHFCSERCRATAAVARHGAKECLSHGRNAVAVANARCALAPGGAREHAAVAP